MNRAIWLNILQVGFEMIVITSLCGSLSACLDHSIWTFFNDVLSPLAIHDTERVQSTNRQNWRGRKNAEPVTMNTKTLLGQVATVLFCSCLVFSVFWTINMTSLISTNHRFRRTESKRKNKVLLDNQLRTVFVMLTVIHCRCCHHVD